MLIQTLLQKKNMSVYRLSKESGIPYATVNDICNGKTELGKCSAGTVYKLAKALGTTMEELVEGYVVERSSFENYKSNVCHQLKSMGDVDFLIHVLDHGEIRTLFERQWYPESLYLLAMLDYISRVNGIPLDKEYDDLRTCKLEETIYPAGILAQSLASGNEEILREAEAESIPEFMRHNIIENEVRNVI